MNNSIPFIEHEAAVCRLERINTRLLALTLISYLILFCLIIRKGIVEKLKRGQV